MQLIIIIIEGAVMALAGDVWGREGGLMEIEYFDIIFYSRRSTTARMKRIKG
jgi:hypothetical protein